MTNPYRAWVQNYARLMAEGRALPLGSTEPSSLPVCQPDAPYVMLFSPHPDDECLTGGLALRLQNEDRWRVVNVAVTLGSRKDRRAGRWSELTAACRCLGFDVVRPAPEGLEQITPRTRSESPEQWRHSVTVLADLLQNCAPAVVVLPHEKDWNGTHMGTHYLVMDALRRMPLSFACSVVETEFWAPMESPNLMVESSPDNVATLVAATACHVGEVQRNPYHLCLPAWMQDNVRRGGELVGGQGGVAPAFNFCTLYRLQVWQDGVLRPALNSNRVMSCADRIGSLFSDAR